MTYPGGEGGGHHQNGETTQSRPPPSLPYTLQVQGWDTSSSGAGWKLGLETASLGQCWGSPLAAIPSPGLSLRVVVASKGRRSLLPVRGWMHTPGQAGEDAATPDGLETPLGPRAAMPAPCRGSGEQLLAAGRGDSPPSLLWAGSVTTHQSLALSSLSEYAPNKPREDVVPVAVGNEPGSRAREQTPSGRALPDAGKTPPAQRNQPRGKTSLPCRARQGSWSQRASGASSPPV